MHREETKHSDLVDKKRKLTSNPLDGVPSEVLNSQNVGDIIDNLDNIDDISDIESIQKKLQGDYKLLARQFGSSRISRVETFISKIEELQNQLRKNTLAHDTFVQNNLPMLDKETSKEVDSVIHTKTLKRRKNYFDEQLHSVDPAGPPEIPTSPPLEELPIFTESFEKVLKPHRESLLALRNKYDYEAKLIEDSIRRNVELTWRQNDKDRMELRKQMRSEITKKLINLDKDYHNYNRNAKVSHNEKRFRTSTRKVGERKGGRYSAMEVHREVENRARKFNTSFHSENKPVSSASASEIENDLQMMKSPFATVKIEKIEANYLYQEQPLKKEVIGPTTMTDLVNSEIEERGVAGMQFQVSTDRNQYQPPQGYNYNYQPPPPPMLLSQHQPQQQQQQQQQQELQQPQQPQQQPVQQPVQQHQMPIQFQSPFPPQQQQQPLPPLPPQQSPPYPQYRHPPLPTQGFFVPQPQQPQMLKYYQNDSPYQQQMQMQGQYPVFTPFRPQT